MNLSKNIFCLHQILKFYLIIFVRFLYLYIDGLDYQACKINLSSNNKTRVAIFAGNCIEKSLAQSVGKTSAPQIAPPIIYRAKSPLLN